MSNLLKIDADRLNIEDIVEKIQTGMGGFNPTVGLPLFSYIWCDHFLDDDNFVRSDDFSWHNGLKYKKAYQHLVDDMANAQMTIWYAFASDDATSVLYTTEEQGEIDIDVVVYDSPDVINEYYTNDVGMIWRDGYILSGKDRPFYRDSTRDIKISQHETETIGDITISFYRAEDGHKICLSEQEDNLQELYETTGISWYYLIDVENQLFKLPRTKYGFTGIRDEVGGYVEAGLPTHTHTRGSMNIKGSIPNVGINQSETTGSSGALYTSASSNNYGGTSTGSAKSNILFDASRNWTGETSAPNNAIYGNSTTVQPPATQMYLYFFLGNGSSETEYEMNILKGGLELGDIGIAPFGIDESQNKRRYLNGQLINQTQFKEFTSLIKGRISLYPSIATTEENWQAEVTNSALGQCGKFVIDDTEGTIRLPKVVNVNGLADLTLMGGIKAESLPNITGDFQLTGAGGSYGLQNGSFYLKTKALGYQHGDAGSNENPKVGFDASLSSSTYQDNAPVQQEAIQYPYFIQVSVGSSLINGTPYINDVEDLKSTSLRTSTITNCLTEIPQDIKLELNNGTLTLKAGSKVYVPNGFEANGVTPKFDEIIVQNDILTNIADNTQCLLVYNVSNPSIWWTTIINHGSGATNPSDLYGFFYNTTDNKVYYLRNSSTPDNITFSLPIAIVTAKGDQTSSIDQVFNGFGYIGSMVFALPGVKGLIPNGRNEDGSLKNIEASVKSVQIFKATGSGYGLTYFITSNGTLQFQNTNACSDGIKPTWFDGGRGTWFDTESNKMFTTTDGGLNWTQEYLFTFGSMYMTNIGCLDYLKTKTTFHTLDYNDKSTIVGWGIPNGSAGIGISGTYTAPTNGLVVIRTNGNGNYCSGSCGGIDYNVGGNFSSYHEADTFVCPLEKGKSCTMSGSYSAMFYPYYGG